MKNHKISLIAAILINMNIMIGAGIYISPPQMAGIAGDLSFWGWIASAIIFLPVVISLSRLSRLYPGEGGIYRYAKTIFGPALGFLGGWSYFLGFVGAQSLQLTVFRQSILDHAQLSLLHQFPWLFNGIFLLVMFGVCTYSLRVLASFQNIFTFVKMLPLLFVISLLFIFPALGGTPSQAVSTSVSTTESSSFISILKVIPFSMFAFWGFGACSNISHRIRGDKRNASRAILISFSLVSLIYALFHFELLRVMGPVALFNEQVSGFASYLGVSESFIMISTTIIIIAISTSYFNAIFSSLISYSFLLQAMAKDGVLFCSRFIKRSNHNQQPVYGIAINCLLTFILASFVGDTQSLVALTNLGILLSFIICLVGLIVISARESLYGTMLIASSGICSCMIIGFVSFSGIQEFVNVLPFVLFFGIGYSLFFFRKKYTEGQVEALDQKTI